MKPFLFLLAFLAFLAVPLRAEVDASLSNAAPAPIFDPMTFFTGHTRSWGAIEGPSGEATDVVRTETFGQIVHGELRLEQDLHFGHKPIQHRSWRMRRLDPHHFVATANDMVGEALGESRGNAFVWGFTLAAKPGHPLYNVRMTQRMYLLPDGRAMINRSAIRKLGIVIAEVTEEFRKVSGDSRRFAPSRR